MNHHDDRVIRQRLPRDDLTHENYNVKQSATIATITMFVATFARLFAQCSLICTTMVLVHHQNDHWQAVCPVGQGLPPVLRRHSRLQILLLVTLFSFLQILSFS